LSTETGVASSAIADGAVLDEAGIERLLEKAVLPAVVSLLSKSGYNLVSERQTRSLTNFLRYVHKILVPYCPDSPLGTNVFVDSNDIDRDSKSLAMKRLHKCIVAYIRQSLDGIAIPLVGKMAQETQQAKALTENQKRQLEDALRAARVGQLHRIRTIIIHLLKYWAPLLGKDDGFAETVLFFCSTKLLLLLSSLSGLENETLSSSSSSLGFVLWSPSDVFCQIWKLLEMQEEWMNRPEWMVQTMTLCAAAEAYGVTTTK
jgi:hypothetical protein